MSYKHHLSFCAVTSPYAPQRQSTGGSDCWREDPDEYTLASEAEDVLFDVVQEPTPNKMWSVLTIDGLQDPTDRDVVRAVFGFFKEIEKSRDFDALETMITSIQAEDFLAYPAGVTVCLTFTQGISSLSVAREALAKRLEPVFDDYGGQEQLDFLLNG